MQWQRWMLSVRLVVLQTRNQGAPRKKLADHMPDPGLKLGIYIT
jgi:hypothetical protein